MQDDGSDQKNLARSPGVDGSFPMWLPDGRTLAFTGFRDGNFEVYTIRADGSRQRNPTKNPAVWQPDRDYPHDQARPAPAARAGL